MDPTQVQPNPPVSGPQPPSDPFPPLMPNKDEQQAQANIQAAELVRQQVQTAYLQQEQHQTPGTTFHPFQPGQTEPPQTATNPEPPEIAKFGPSDPSQSPQTPSSVPPLPIESPAPTTAQPSLPPLAAPQQQTEVTPYRDYDPKAVAPNAGDKQTVADLRQQILKKVETAKEERAARTKPLLVAVAVVILFLSVSYNEVAVAQIRQYIAPGSTVSTPIILDPSENVEVGKEQRIIIPKINVDVPVVYDVTSYDEDEIQNALERGVVHYGRTALPGEQGNNVIVGHSSNNFFNSGKYKFAFVLLDRLEIGDTFILHYDEARYIYRVSNKQVIEPDDFSLVQPTDTPTTTLITCTPPGTSWRRLVIQGEQISPSPGGAKESTAEVPETVDTPVPGNAPSFWQQVRDIF